MRHLLLTVALAIGLSTSIIEVASAQQLKTAAQCNADYSANKAAIKNAKIKKRDFVASCRAGNETIPGTAAATAPTPAVAPAPVPSTPSPTPSRRKLVPPTSAGTGSPVGAYQFASAAEAGSRCPGATIVWGQYRLGRLSLRRRAQLRSHESWRLHVRNGCDRGRRSCLEDREAPVRVFIVAASPCSIIRQHRRGRACERAPDRSGSPCRSACTLVRRSPSAMRIAQPLL